MVRNHLDESPRVPGYDVFPTHKNMVELKEGGTEGGAGTGGFQTKSARRKERYVPDRRIQPAKLKLQIHTYAILSIFIYTCFMEALSQGPVAESSSVDQRRVSDIVLAFPGGSCLQHQWAELAAQGRPFRGTKRRHPPQEDR